MTVDSIIQTKDFILFVDRATSFCSLLETHQSDNYKAFISDIQKRLIELYTFAQTLPNFDLPDRDLKETHITDNDIRQLLSFVADRLRDPYYWIVFDPTDHNDTSSACGDLIDDLGDIYKDIKTFLTDFNDPNDDVKQTALWHLKWSFDSHWNDHCINAIYAIHYLLKHAD